MKLVFEGNLAPPDIEDGKQSYTFDIEDVAHPRMFVKLHSWDPTKEHIEAKHLVDGALVRVTVEVLDFRPKDQRVN